MGIEWYGGLTTGIILVLLGQLLTFHLNRRRTRDERLMEMYAEFAGIAAEDLERARTIDAMLVTKPGYSDKPRFEAWVRVFGELEEDRHRHRGQMARLRFQISTLEKDNGIVVKLSEICKAQPAFNRLGGWEGSRYDKQVQIHEDEIKSYSKKIDELVCKVRVK